MLPTKLAAAAWSMLVARELSSSFSPLVVEVSAPFVSELSPLLLVLVVLGVKPSGQVNMSAFKVDLSKQAYSPPPSPPNAKLVISGDVTSTLVQEVSSLSRFESLRSCRGEETKIFS